MTMTTTEHKKFKDAESLRAWEPLDGYAILTCKIRVQCGAYDAWEPRTYEFTRAGNGWTASPGYMYRPSWDDLVSWLSRMQPIDIDLLTTV